MKLSEILKDWPVKEVNEYYGDYGIRNEGFNDALISCDREIDREALAKELYNKFYKCETKTKSDFEIMAEKIIATMPTWLKPTERK